MANWISHLIVADRVLDAVPQLLRHEFCVGNIAPDCNVENADWTSFTPPREVTHWMSGSRKTAADSDRFYREYLLPRARPGNPEESFFLGYWTHLIVDAVLQRHIRDADRVAAAWKRVIAHPALQSAAQALPPTWDSVKRLIPRQDREQDVADFELDYLEQHPSSGYLTEILPLQDFPDYIDYLPPGAIPRKVRVMGGLPRRAASRYPGVAMSAEEYAAFLSEATALAVEAIAGHFHP